MGTSEVTREKRTLVRQNDSTFDISGRTGYIAVIVLTSNRRTTTVVRGENALAGASRCVSARLGFGRGSASGGAVSRGSLQWAFGTCRTTTILTRL